MLPLYLSCSLNIRGYLQTTAAGTNNYWFLSSPVIGIAVHQFFFFQQILCSLKHHYNLKNKKQFTLDTMKKNYENPNNSKLQGVWNLSQQVTAQSLSTREQRHKLGISRQKSTETVKPSSDTKYAIPRLFKDERTHLELYISNPESQSLTMNLKMVSRWSKETRFTGLNFAPKSLPHSWLWPCLEIGPL